MGFAARRAVWLAAFIAVASSLAAPVAGQECLETVGSIPGGDAHAISADDDIAYLGLEHWFQTVDVSDPDRPTVKASLRIPPARRGVGDIEVVGSLAYLSVGPHLGRGALLIVDVTDPADPFIIGTVEVPGYSGKISLLGDFALVANSNGLWIVDVADPREPAQIGFIEPFGPAVDVAASGTLAFVINDGHLGGEEPGVNVIDLTDPTEPDIVGRLVIPYWGFEVEISGDFLFVANGDSGLRVIDIGNPSSPTLVATLNTPGSAVAVDLEVEDNNRILALADGAAGLRIIDVTVPTRPIEIGAIQSEWVGDIVVSGNLAYGITAHGAPHVIDISDPSNPIEIGVLPPQPAHFGLPAVQDDLVASLTSSTQSTSGLWLFDVHDPTSPSAIGHFWLSWPSRVEISGSSAFVLTREGIHVIDISDPSVPIEIAYFQPPGNHQLWHMERSGDLIATYTYSTGEVYLVDVADPALPELVGEIDFGHFPLVDFALDGDLLIANRYNNELTIIDVSVPGSPVKIGTFPNFTNGWSIYDLELSDDVAYIHGNASYPGAPPWHRVAAVDVANSTSPQLVAEFGEWPGWFDVANGFAVDSDTYRQKLRLINTGPLASPVEVFSRYTSGAPGGTARSGKYIYLSSDGAALDILYNCSVFADGFDLGRTTAWSEVTE